MRLNDLSPEKGSRKKRKRIGRGNASGNGTTAGRGSKGHCARSGGGVRPGYEGGQMPIHRRLPKRGFTNIFKKNIAILNISDLTRFEAGTVIDLETLIKERLVNGKFDGVKILGKGEIDHPLQIKIHSISNGAKEKIEKAGGKIEVI